MISTRAIVLAILTAAAVSHARAEDAAPTPSPSETPAPVASPAPPAAPTPTGVAPGAVHFYLEVDQADIGYISQALNYLPKYVADPLILKLNAQLSAQAPIAEAKDKADKARKGKK